MSKEKKIQGTDEAWDNGELGRDENYVAKSKITKEMVDEALALQSISIRLPKSLIDDFKLIANLNGLGYQTLMRQILKRFADAEIKQIVRECLLTHEEEEERSRLMAEMEKKKEKKAV